MPYKAITGISRTTQLVDSKIKTAFCFLYFTENKKKEE
jgi:hypothetical protein